MQYPIPQFIEAEGKIIFFLTFKQFFMLIGGGAICAVVYLLLPFQLFVIAALLVMGLTGTVAFVKLDGVSVVTILFNFLGFTVGSKVYTWKKKEATYPFKIQKKPELANIENIQEVAPAKMQPSKLNDIKKLIETKR